MARRGRLHDHLDHGLQEKQTLDAFLPLGGSNAVQRRRTCRPVERPVSEAAGACAEAPP